jgi:hypothetical protein
MDQDRVNENISQDEEASLIKGLVDNATGPRDFNRLNNEDVDGADLINLPDRSLSNVAGREEEVEGDDEEEEGEDGEANKDATSEKDKRAAEAALKEADWSNYEAAEMIDDPVRMYLREIGRVSLLKAHEERVLARNMESSGYIDSLTEQLSSPDGRPPQAWQIVLHFLNSACSSTDTINALSRFMNIEDELTLGELRFSWQSKDHS